MEKKKISENASASLIGNPINSDQGKIHGIFTAECYDAQGNFKWSAEAPNHVMTEGTNLMLDTALEGSAYTATVYMGLISSTSWTQTAVGDTAAQIGGTNQWNEAGATYPPDYSGDRKTAAFSAAFNATWKNVLQNSFTMNFIFSASNLTA